MVDSSFHKTEEILFRFMNNEIILSDFETWIYANDSLESLLGSDHYLDLISFDFTQYQADKTLKCMLESWFDRPVYDMWRIKRYLQFIVDEEGDPVEAVEGLFNLYIDDGYHFLRDIVIHSNDIGDKIPKLYHKPLWNDHAFAEKRKLLALYLDYLKPQAVNLLRALKADQIKIIE